MSLSEDEIKILITLLEQLNYKLEGAAVVLPILKKLKEGITQPITQPDLKPSEVSGVNVGNEPVNPEPEVIDEPAP